MKIKLFSTSEILTLNALDQLKKTNLDPQTFKLINAIVFNVCDQLQNSEQLKKHKITINN